MLNLNLGSGNKKIKNYINLDKFDTFKPDIVHDLENFPYPFEDNSVANIALSHVLEHIGQNPDDFNMIVDNYWINDKMEGALSNREVPGAVNFLRPQSDYITDETYVWRFDTCRIQFSYSRGVL